MNTNVGDLQRMVESRDGIIRLRDRHIEQLDLENDQLIDALRLTVAALKMAQQRHDHAASGPVCWSNLDMKQVDHALDESAKALA